ncbi:hypothetical protein [Bdellovibrio sp. KM01]|uniref:hypothetical protein n=1 Tax=Bdellovibrio sp. KM01 TaxID=2748865 RepID=UPI0015E98E18|nr:hypothetical protein [Bdellovibrio sp. KM01]QLY25621.1 hypothetical protein HW988_00785 [Bdellovibrio sp. KM01]
MKKAFIIGMTLAFSATAFAAPGKMTTTERLAKFDKTSQEYFLDSNGNLKNASGKNAEKKYLEQSLRDISKNETQIVDNALKYGTKEFGFGDPKMKSEVMKNLVSIVAAKKASEKITDGAEAKEVSDSASGLANMLGKMHLLKAAESRELTKEQNAIAIEAFDKSVRLGTQILTQFQGAERSSYARVLAKFTELSSNSNKLPSEILVDSVMESQKVSREKAIEILRKLKDCV